MLYAKRREVDCCHLTGDGASAEPGSRADGLRSLKLPYSHVLRSNLAPQKQVSSWPKTHKRVKNTILLHASGVQEGLTGSYGDSETL